MSSDDRQVIIDFDSSPLVSLLLCVSRKIASSWMWRKRICPEFTSRNSIFEWCIIELVEGQKYPGSLECSIALFYLWMDQSFLAMWTTWHKGLLCHTVYISRISVVIIQQFAFLGLAKQFRVKSLTLCSEPHQSHCTWNNVFQNVFSLNYCLFSMLRRIFCWLMMLMTTCQLWGTAK